MNNVCLVGNLGQDAEIKEFTRSNGESGNVANFSIAVKRDKDTSDWIDISAFVSPNLAQYLTKGTRVGINGRLQKDTWKTKEGENRSKVKVVTSGFGVELLGGDKKKSAEEDCPF